MAARLRNNVILGATRLIPMIGNSSVPHSMRNRVLELLERSKQRTMIVDITALVWNFDTYAIVGGCPTPVRVKLIKGAGVSDREVLEMYIKFVDAHDGTTDKSFITVAEGVLVPEGVGSTKVWVPEGAQLISTSTQVDAEGCTEYEFRPRVDPNNDRLEHWEQEVTGPKRHVASNRAQKAREAIRNMLRFFDLDSVICWDLSWGYWEVQRRDTAMMGKLDSASDPSLESAHAFNALAVPITTDILKQHLSDQATGYYLMGGSTYTMSLFHNMWDRQEGGGHKALLKELIVNERLFYIGHSAGAIMSSRNIVTATWKGIDAFSHSIQPYNKDFVRLPPSEASNGTFFLPDLDKNDLRASRLHMLAKMRQSGAWDGFDLMGDKMFFPHYDSRPRYQSFPQSAEVYLRATDESGRFCQLEPSFFVPPAESAVIDSSCEPEDVRCLREGTNGPSDDSLPRFSVIPIANGHAVGVRPGGGGGAFSHYSEYDIFSPEEEGLPGQQLHWDTYMPMVKDPSYSQYEPGRRTHFTAGTISRCSAVMAGDRSGTAVNMDNVQQSATYGGARIISRLKALGLPHPSPNEQGVFYSE